MSLDFEELRDMGRGLIDLQGDVRLESPRGDQGLSYLLTKLDRLPVDHEGTTLGDRATITVRPDIGHIFFDGVRLDLETELTSAFEPFDANSDAPPNEVTYTLAQALDTLLGELAGYHAEAGFYLVANDRAVDECENTVVELLAFGVDDSANARANARFSAEIAAQNLRTAAADAMRRQGAETVRSHTDVPSMGMTVGPADRNVPPADEPVHMVMSLSSYDCGETKASASVTSDTYTRIQAAYGAVIGGLMEAARVRAEPASLDFDDRAIIDAKHYEAVWVVERDGVKFEQKHKADQTRFESELLGWPDFEFAISEAAPPERESGIAMNTIDEGHHRFNLDQIMPGPSL